MHQLTEKWMQPAFCHDSQWSRSVTQNENFINLAFCPEKQTKNPTKQVFPGMCSTAGSSTGIVHMVLQTWWLTAKLSAEPVESRHCATLTRQGCKIFWMQMRTIIQTKKVLHRLYTGRRQDETVWEDLLDSNNFYNLFKTIYAALDLLETVLTTLFMCNDSRPTF